MISKIEINLRRLLIQCEKLTSTNECNNNWRLEKYVAALEDLLNDLHRSPSCPPVETFAEYERRIKFLKKLFEAEKLPTVIEKAVASQTLRPKFTSSNEKLTREIHLQVSSKYANEIKKELFGNDEGGLRHRSKDGNAEDLNSILRYHQDAQEKLAEEMVGIARNMKENSLLASTIVKQDLETLDKSMKLTDQNYSKLKVESEVLEEHTQRACSWWIWILLVVVSFTFIFMVLFMKMFPKS